MPAAGVSQVDGFGAPDELEGFQTFADLVARPDLAHDSGASVLLPSMLIAAHQMSMCATHSICRMRRRGPHFSRCYAAALSHTLKCRDADRCSRRQTSPDARR